MHPIANAEQAVVGARAIGEAISQVLRMYLSASPASHWRPLPTERQDLNTWPDAVKSLATGTDPP